MEASVVDVLDPLAALNDAQRGAVVHGPGARPAAPLAIIAGAGSGKTSTLAHRVARLIRDGADPQRILLLTFSRRAAQTLERRATEVLQQATRARHIEPPSLAWVGTFHGIGARLLREYAERIGLSVEFTIHDRGDAQDLMGLARQEQRIDTSATRFPGDATCLAIYSRVVNAEAALHDVLRDTFAWCAACEDALKALFATYVTMKQEQWVLDYDDLLLYWAAMMDEPAFAAELGARFDHVLVDEYQDTNRLQARILRALKPDGLGVTVVGDDAQAIYSFRAATVRNILDFPAQFQPPARVVTLQRNYRSSSHSAPLELELARRNIPYVKFGGLRFLDAAHVKDVLAVLRWAANPRSRLDGFRVVRLLPGIGPATAARLVDGVDPTRTLWAAMREQRVPDSAREGWNRLAEGLEALASPATGWPAEMDAVLRWYEPQMAQRYEDSKVRAADLVQLRRIAQTYASRERFLTDLALDPPTTTSDEAGPPLRDEDYLILSTIHSSKGQEWKAVQVLNVVDGCIPSDLATGSSAEIEEERRLLYVAMTRAKDHLALLIPHRFYVRQQSASGDRHVLASRSRFIPPPLEHHFAAVAWSRTAEPEGQSAGGRAATTIDVAARLKAAWL